ncbi:formylmethanofuran dehydrogenase subunit A [Methanosphaerula palustris]|uniref:Formylmethanofuran dehydrogenase subunit A n=1 Tax=Methanosphaerula palustris (strain ATCC BAA-1556 / DSM 19958 / E1-9c) TaxID=521011 RepID=B8GE26_METPE|nr:formylmethanofuran dehydrogenase subunit A [Methanosphaerula palustris]ACL17527.1 formylmethanofuran dehydrogenase subunit A [Methanosphaerula palustris E1-9c]
MTEYLIKNGFVFDAVSGVKGDKADIAIKDGRIVETSELSSKAEQIDANGKTVMAGAVEIHAHVAGPKVNEGRNYRPEDKLFGCTPKTATSRMGGGFSIPTTFKTGYTYAKMGYTTVMEAAMPPLYARHVHEEICDTPIIDQGAFPVFGNNWFMLEYLKNNEIENAAAYIAWLLRAAKGYAVKVVNPGGTEAWAWGLNCLSVNDPVPYFDITPAQIVKGLLEANEYLGLPHSIHVHSNNLGNPGNYTTTLDTLKIAEGYKTHNKFGREQVMHHTHLQFHSYGGDSWLNFESKAKEMMDYVNAQKNLTIDLGCVTLDETTTMTADGPFEHHLTELNHLKWANVDVELETAAGIVPYIYSPNVKVCGIQWAIGLELALFAKDPMRTFITTDHPNAGPFTRYPRIFKWLMSQEARQERLDTFKWSQKVIDATNLAEIDREITLYELSQMTRAGPAKALGLTEMCGGLKPGMDADVVVYNFNPEAPFTPDQIETAFTCADDVFKCGVHVVKNGEVISNGNKRTLWVNAKVRDNPQVMHDVEEKFLKYYSVNQNNYEVSGHHYLPNPYVLEVDATE